MARQTVRHLGILGVRMRPKWK